MYGDLGCGKAVFILVNNNGFGRVTHMGSSAFSRAAQKQLLVLKDKRKKFECLLPKGNFE